MADIQPFPHVIGPDGRPRYLACLGPRPDFGGFPRFAAANKLIPRDQWRDVDLLTRPGSAGQSVPVLDQGQHGSCVGHGSLLAFWIAYLLAGGTVPEGGFSPTSLYALVNGGRDQGAVVSDAMDALIRIGVALMADYPESVIFDRQLSPDTFARVQAARKRFRVADAFHCSTFDAIGSALQLGFPVSFGITICGPFQQRIRPDGLIEAGGFPIGGHCLAAYGTTKLPDGRWVLRVRNSWSASWGNGGNCLLPEGHFRGDCDAFAIRADMTDPQDSNPAPIAR